MASRTLVHDHAARSDLIGIWIYSFDQWGAAQADRYLLALERGVKNLVANPQRGNRRDTLRAGY